MLLNYAKYSLATATSVVIANMIGTGVFTCLGFQLLEIKNYAAILSLWIFGGMVSLCGAFCYAELGSQYPQSGGEYNFLKSIFNPLLGFLSGWISATIGFAAPISLAAYSLGVYFKTVIPSVSIKITAFLVIIFIGLLQSMHVKIGGRFQKIATLLKVLLILGFIVVGLFFTPSHPDFKLNLNADTLSYLFSWPFAAAMFWVSFAYSGWNAAAYIAGDIKNPTKNLPRALLIGTLLVTMLYVGLNFVFLKVAPYSELTVKFTDQGPVNIDTGNVAGKFMFGESGVKIVGLVISLLLVSSISAMIMAGPRVISAMGKDYSIFSAFAKSNKGGSPVLAIWVLCTISVLLLFTGTFNQILEFTSFVLILFSTLTVSGLIFSRYKYPQATRPFKTPLYPFIPLLFILCNIWFMYQAVLHNPLNTLIGVLIVVSGIPVFYMSKGSSKTKTVLTK